MTATIKQTIPAALLFLLVLHTSCHHAYASEQTNLLKNPGFEEVGTWRTSTSDLNDVADPRNMSNPHTGKYSAYTKATTIGGDGYAFVHQNVSISMDRSLEFLFWLYVKRPDLPFNGYIKGFITTAKGRFFDLGIWSDLPAPKPNEYRIQVKLEQYDSWFRITARLGKLWIDEAKFPGDDTIISVSLGIYNGLVYALPKNVLQLEVFFDDIFLGPSTVEEEPRLPWLLIASTTIAVSMVTLAFLERRRRSKLPSGRRSESVSRKLFEEWLRTPRGGCGTPAVPVRPLCSQAESLMTFLGGERLAISGPGGRGLLV